MKLFHYLTAAVAATAILASCESPSRLASQVEGEWAGAPQRITDTDFSYVSLTPAYEFVRDGADSKGGTITLTAQTDISLPADGFQADSIGETPVSFTVAAVVTASGTWKAVDDDEIVVHFNPSTVVTSIDSEAVCEYTSPISVTDRAATVELPAQSIKSISRQLTTTVTAFVGSVHKFDDIKVKDTLMKCEIGKKDYTFSRI